MLAKLITVVIVATAVAAVLLGLRQQRLQLMHEMAAMHSRINDNRQVMWDLQVRIAERTQPEALHAALARAELEVQPIVPDTPATPLTEVPGVQR